MKGWIVRMGEVVKHKLTTVHVHGMLSMNDAVNPQSLLSNGVIVRPRYDC